MSSIAYDFDTSPTKRKENSFFYGYIPDSANERMIAFFSLFVACTTHCGWRIFSSSLLIMVDWRYFVGWITGEVSERMRRRGRKREERLTDHFIADLTVLGVQVLHGGLPILDPGRWPSGLLVQPHEEDRRQVRH
jgi:hypothetical protein